MKKTPYVVTGIVFLALGFLLVLAFDNRAAIQDFRQQNQAERVKALAQITEGIQETLQEVRRGVGKTLDLVRRLFGIHDPDSFPEEPNFSSKPPNDRGRKSNGPPTPNPPTPKPSPKPSPICLVEELCIGP